MKVLKGTENFVRAFKREFKSEIAKNDPKHLWSGDHVLHYLRMILQEGSSAGFIEERSAIKIIRALKKIKRTRTIVSEVSKKKRKPHLEEDTYKHSILIVRNKKDKPKKQPPTFT